MKFYQNLSFTFQKCQPKKENWTIVLLYPKSKKWQIFWDRGVKDILFSVIIAYCVLQFFPVYWLHSRSGIFFEKFQMSLLTIDQIVCLDFLMKQKTIFSVSRCQYYPFCTRVMAIMGWGEGSKGLRWVIVSQILEKIWEQM